MPTPSGWRLLTLGAAAVIGGRAFGVTEFQVVGATGVAAVVLALAVRLAHPSKLTVERRASAAMVPVSGHVTVSLTVTNWARSRSPTVSVREPVSDGAESRLVVAALPGGASATGRYRLEATRRGVLEIGPSQLDDTDGLGLARRRRRVPPRTRVIVHPVVEELAMSPASSSDDPATPSDLTRRSTRFDSDEFDILRPYVSGDDPRHIHWRSTAHFGDLMVRRFQPARPGRLTLVIDTRPPGDLEQVQDVTTSVAASIASAVLKAGDEARVLTTDGRGTPLMSKASQVGEMLEFMALLSGGADEIGLSPPSDGSVVVAVSASQEAVESTEARIMLAKRLRASMIITCGSGGERSPEAGADPSRNWMHLTGPGQLSRLWRMPAPLGTASAA